MAPCSGGTDPNRPAPEELTILFAQSAPDARFLTGIDRPLQALVDDTAGAAYALGFIDLHERRANVPNREEELRIFVTAGSLVAPVHAVLLPACRATITRTSSPISKFRALQFASNLGSDCVVYFRWRMVPRFP